MHPLPNFRDPHFLEDHIRHTLTFYHPRCINPQGGFFQHFRDDGSLYDRETRHLVSSTRFVFNYAMAALHFQNPEYRTWAEHGIRFLREKHRQGEGGYVWILRGPEVVDATLHCYGHAFVLLAYACGLKAGIPECAQYLTETFALMEEHFWSEADGLYADEFTANWGSLSPYRGQNANMHTCEALIAAYEATQNQHYLERALTLAHNLCERQAALSPLGLIWEHYDSNWDPDWDYNRSDPRHLFRPWGYQPGHQTEWAKLLLILERHAHGLLTQGSQSLVDKAQFLFNRAVQLAWDPEYSGLRYGLDLQGQVWDSDKYFWVQAESLAAAALLALRTGDPSYWDWYDRIWAYSWEHFIDHQHGAWYRILNRANQKYDDLKSPAGKTDYHTMGACYEVLRSLRIDSRDSGSLEPGSTKPGPSAIRATN
ncbi:AGE family epimerase/isomerase [Thermostichus vulcanus]|uniref:AGE family epimerase/isomerase n=1 Tax=Thermostichus vulcanus str. 'Rupite' TaxID=2813851 RepID=A0ABT0CE58_THEVL|nr:AGE family epimerase/isomerase [Thermostichus vulcanus]MCJ2544051.1 AGE family epimerase/isomerase [Thermostichus vulcanus str. 'Rupite']